MHIGIITKRNYSTINTLKIELESRGHQISFIKDLIFRLNDPSINDLPKNLDLIYYWNGLGKAGSSCLCDHLEKLKIPMINSGLIHDQLYMNKIYQSYTVAKNGIKIPKAIIQATAKYEDLIKEIGSPFILKSATGSCGKYVYLIKSLEEFNNAKIKLKDKELIFQEFIPNNGDYRIHVVGGKAVCAYKREPAVNEFRSNIHQGGKMVTIDDADLLQKLYTISEKAVGSFKGLEITGIDLIQDITNGKIYFIESNSKPGMDIEDAEITGLKIEAKVVDYFESLVK